jgi:hypothetical protein
MRGLGTLNNADFTLQVVSTDYSTYAVLSSCNVTSIYGQDVLVLSRKSYLSNEGNIMIYNALEKIKFHSNFLADTLFDPITCNGYKISKNFAYYLFYYIFLFTTKKIILNYI